jgi:hypothetical protein
MAQKSTPCNGFSQRRAYHGSCETRETRNSPSRSATLAPAHNGIVIPADKRRDSVTFRNVVQAYHSTGVLLRMILIVSSTAVLQYTSTIENDSHLQEYSSTIVQAYYAPSSILRQHNMRLCAYAAMRLQDY